MLYLVFYSYKKIKTCHALAVQLFPWLGSVTRQPGETPGSEVATKKKIYIYIVFALFCSLETNKILAVNYLASEVLVVGVSCP